MKNDVMLSENEKVKYNEILNSLDKEFPVDVSHETSMVKTTKKKVFTHKQKVFLISEVVVFLIPTILVWSLILL